MSVFAFGVFITYSIYTFMNKHGKSAHIHWLATYSLGNSFCHTYLNSTSVCHVNNHISVNNHAGGVS